MSLALRRELATWAQYLIIALAAELIAFWGAFGPRSEEGGVVAYALPGFVRKQYLEYERPRLWYWLAAFTVMAAARFLIFYILHRRRARF